MRTANLTLGAALVGALALTGCSSTTSTGNTSEGDIGSGIRVAMVTQIEGIPYYAGFKDGAEQAAKDLGISYTQVGPAKVDPAEQVRILDNLVSQEFDAIAISPLDPTSINTSIKNARAEGIAIGTSDADAPDSERQVFVSQGTDEALGAAVMDALADGMDEKGQFAIVSGSADTAIFNSWIANAEKRLEEAYPNMELVGGIRHALDSAAALTEAQNLITAYPELKGIIAVPSTAVPGVGQAVTNAGKIGKIAVTGFGSPKTAGPFLESGAMSSTVLWDVAKLGYLTVWALNTIATGGKFEAENTVPGFDEPVVYDSASKTLLLGDPQVFTKADYADYSF